MDDDELGRIWDALHDQDDTITHMFEMLRDMLSMRESRQSMGDDIEQQAMWTDRNFLRVSAFAARRSQASGEPIYVVQHGGCWMEVSAIEIDKLGIDWDAVEECFCHFPDGVANGRRLEVVLPYVGVDLISNRL